MLLNCLLGWCYFLAPVALDPMTHGLSYAGGERMYVEKCEFSQTLAVLQCVPEPDVIFRSGLE